MPISLNIGAPAPPIEMGSHSPSTARQAERLVNGYREPGILFEIRGSKYLKKREEGARRAAFFVFHAMFCGTCITIVSGAVAERMRFSGYLMVAILKPFGYVQT